MASRDKQSKTSARYKGSRQPQKIAAALDLPVLKLGMIFECGPQGADKKVCEYLAKRLHPDKNVEIISVTLDVKPNLIANCGFVTAQLLKEGCERVAIIWDLSDWTAKPCLIQDKEDIEKSLENAGVKQSNVHLICIRDELEAWLLADGRAISAVLSTNEHPKRIPDVRNPEKETNAKKRINGIFQKNVGRRYSDLIHAEEIIRQLPDFNRIKRCPSFLRFAERFLEATL